MAETSKAARTIVEEVETVVALMKAMFAIGGITPMLCELNDMEPIARKIVENVAGDASLSTLLSMLRDLALSANRLRVMLQLIRETLSA